MKIEWAILAEGIGTASNGAVTVIGANQNLIVSPTLPVSAKRAVMVHLTADEDDLTGVDLRVALSVMSPSGAVLAEQAGSAETGEPQWPDLPVTFDIFTEFSMQLTEYGPHVVNVTVERQNGENVASKVNLYVYEPLNNSA